VRLPWVYGASGLLRDLIVGMRIRRYRIVGIGDNRWALLSADDAAAALVAAASAPPGVYTAAEEPAPTQLDVVDALTAIPGHPRPDRVPPRFAALSMGGAMAEALATSLDIRAGRLADHGWAPRADWREEVLTLARNPLPLPG
jgi:nucleoside-diphosphate-sugar epimerase